MAGKTSVRVLKKPAMTIKERRAAKRIKIQDSRMTMPRRKGDGRS